MAETTAKSATPRQLVFECKLKGGVATLELRTHGGVKDGVHRWTQLSAEVLIQAPKKKREAFPCPRPVRIVWSMTDLSRCRLARWTLDNSLWMGSTSFDVERADDPRLTEFLVSLGVEIEDHTKVGS